MLSVLPAFFVSSAESHKENTRALQASYAGKALWPDTMREVLQFRRGGVGLRG